MPLQVIAIRRSGVEDVELRLGASVGKCRRKAARCWSCPASRVLLRTPGGELLQDDGLVLRMEILLSASLLPYKVRASFLTVGCPTAACDDGDRCADTVVRLPRGDAESLSGRALKEQVAKALGVPHSAFMMHQLPGGEDLSDNEGPPSESEQEEAETEEVEGDEQIANQEIQEVAAPSPPLSPTAQDKGPPVPPEIPAEDAGFEEVLRLRALAHEAALHAYTARRAAAEAALHIRPAEEALARAMWALEKEKPVEARENADRAQAQLEAAQRAVAEAAAAAEAAAPLPPAAAEALECAKVVVENQSASSKAARDAAREAGRALQQARIARKKVADAVAAVKEAEADRDAKNAELSRLEGCANSVRDLPDATAASAAAAASSAAQAVDVIPLVQESAARAAEVAAQAEADAAAVARAWEEEAAEARAQGYGDPPLEQALRDVHDLMQLGVRCVLVRLRPRLSRLLTELRCCNELWEPMGAGDAESPGRPWTRGVVATQALLRGEGPAIATHNGDVVLRQEPGRPYSWRAAVRGPRASPYEAMYFWLRADFPPEWPKAPPALRFVTPIYHLNVGEDGAIHAAARPLARIREAWTPTSTVYPFLGAILALLCLPDELAPQRPELASLFAVDREAYVAQARARAHECGQTEEAMRSAHA